MESPAVRAKRRQRKALRKKEETRNASLASVYRTTPVSKKRLQRMAEPRFQERDPVTSLPIVKQQPTSVPVHDASSDGTEQVGRRVTPPGSTTPTAGGTAAQVRAAAASTNGKVRPQRSVLFEHEPRRAATAAQPRRPAVGARATTSHAASRGGRHKHASGGSSGAADECRPHTTIRGVRGAEDRTLEEAPPAGGRLLPGGKSAGPVKPHFIDDKPSAKVPKSWLKESPYNYTSKPGATKPRSVRGRRPKLAAGPDHELSALDKRVVEYENAWAARWDTEDAEREGRGRSRSRSRSRSPRGRKGTSPLGRDTMLEPEARAASPRQRTADLSGSYEQMLSSASASPRSTRSRSRSRSGSGSADGGVSRWTDGAASKPPNVADFTATGELEMLAQDAENAAATRIQARARGAAVRKTAPAAGEMRERVIAEKHRKAGAAVKIQSAQRAKVARREVDEVRKRKNAAAVTIQKHAKGAQARKKVKQQRQEAVERQDQAARTIQSAARGTSARRTARQLAGLKDALLRRQRLIEEAAAKGEPLVVPGAPEVVEDVVAALNEVTREQFETIAALKETPALVALFSALCILMRAEPTYANAQEQLRKPSFKSIISVLEHGHVKPAARMTARKLLINADVIAQHKDSKVPGLAALSNWVGMVVSEQKIAVTKEDLRDEAKRALERAVAAHSRGTRVDTVSFTAEQRIEAGLQDKHNPAPSINLAFLRRSRERVLELTMEDYAEISTQETPTENLIGIAAALDTLYSFKEPSWSATRKMLGSPAVIRACVELSPLDVDRRSLAMAALLCLQRNVRAIPYQKDAGKAEKALAMWLTAFTATEDRHVQVERLDPAASETAKLAAAGEARVRNVAVEAVDAFSTLQEKSVGARSQVAVLTAQQRLKAALLNPAKAIKNIDQEFFERAREELRNLRDMDLLSLAALTTPPPDAVVVAAALCSLIESPAKWKSMRKMLRQSKFLTVLLQLTPQKVSKKGLKTACTLCASNNVFAVASASNNKATRLLGRWVCAITGTEDRVIDVNSGVRFDVAEARAKEAAETEARRKERHDAAVKIQSVQRGTATRKRVNEERLALLRNEAAKTIQAMARARAGRKFAALVRQVAAEAEEAKKRKLLREAEARALVAEQAKADAEAAAKAAAAEGVDAKESEETAAAKKIQAAARGKFARDVVDEMVVMAKEGFDARVYGTGNAEPNARVQVARARFRALRTDAAFEAHEDAVALAFAKLSSRLVLTHAAIAALCAEKKPTPERAILAGITLMIFGEPKPTWRAARKLFRAKGELKRRMMTLGFLDSTLFGNGFWKKIQGVGSPAEIEIVRWCGCMVCVPEVVESTQELAGEWAPSEGIEGVAKRLAKAYPALESELMESARAVESATASQAASHASADGDVGGDAAAAQ